MHTTLPFKTGLRLGFDTGLGHGNARISDRTSSLDDFSFPESSEPSLSLDSLLDIKEDNDFVVVLQTLVGW